MNSVRPDPKHGPRGWLAALALAPLFFTFAWLAGDLATLLPDALREIVVRLPVPFATIVASAALLGASLRGSDRARTLRTAALLVPCFLAPTALLHPWSLAPSNLPGGVGWGGVTLFSNWLTKYPNFGPVNIEVLAGLGAVLVLGVLPVVFAGLVLRRAGRVVPVLTMFVTGIAYAPVLIRLDLALVGAAWFGSEDLWLLFLMYGPVTHFLAVVSMLALALSVRRG